MEKLLCKLCAICILLLVALMAVIVFTFYACGTSTTVDNTPVKSLNLNKFLGEWYEIARLDHSFERGMDYCTATYELKNDGTILVTNKGKKDGKWKISTGKGKVTEVPGLLRVSFFGPFYSDYRILMLASDYSYALVGGSDDDYLWILSRTPKLKEDVRRRLVDEAQKRGYNTNRLIWVAHK